MHTHTGVINYRLNNFNQMVDEIKEAYGCCLLEYSVLESSISI